MTDVLFNEEHFLASLAEDKELAQELLAAFLLDSPKRTAELRNAIAADDALTSSKLAHSLKGMCGVVRAERLSDLALAMEHLAKNGDMVEVKKQFDLFTQSFDQAMALMQAYLGRG